jgi:1-aminocyclopropane-1-carboxylate deaminase/D-cysteine desulfhydrase-like pyridoxal-dependent ACC family enzyme
MTVSATGTGGTPAGYLLQVLVLTGANSTQAGVTAGATNSSGSSTALQLAMTPGAAGNMVFGAAMNWANSTAPTLLASTWRIEA